MFVGTVSLLMREMVKLQIKAMLTPITSQNANAIAAVVATDAMAAPAAVKSKGKTKKAKPTQAPMEQAKALPV